MGTSLNGLNPASTYQALIKVGNNTNLNTTLKTLSDGAGNDLPMQASTTAINFTGTVSGVASGVSGAIQFSNGSAFASDATNLFWDDTNNRLGVGTNAPTTSLQIDYTSSLLNGILINQTGGTNNFSSIGFANNGTIRSTLGMNLNSGEVRWFNNSGGYFATIYSNGVEAMRIDGSQNVNIGATALGARVGIKGSGSTSATTSLLVQNSGGNSALTILDNLNSQFGGTVISDGGFRSIAYFDSFQRVSLNNGLNTNPQNYLISGGVGRILLVDNSEGDFNRLQFGGTTSSYPSLKRSTTNLQVRLADDSGYAPIDASLYKVGGTNGFTGTGSYTNFTIVGGIITNAS